MSSSTSEKCAQTPERFTSYDAEENSKAMKRLSRQLKINRDLEKRGIDLSDSQSDDDLMVECVPPQSFQGYTMNFLKNAINYNFNFPAKLVQKKFNFHVQNIHQLDKKRINRIFKRVNENLKLKGQDAFMNNKNAEYLGNSFPGVQIQYMEENQWKISIVIQGFKTSNNGNLSPIWKIIRARLV